MLLSPLEASRGFGALGVLGPSGNWLELQIVLGVSHFLLSALEHPGEARQAKEGPGVA